MLILKSEKRKITEVIKLLNEEIIRMLGEKKITRTWGCWKWTT